ncbi:phage tail spike protein [Staphylococcus felis]|uniref:phage tail spike protein n=1 Tax=Staphylococcus felis TaxID=46127 RepID=UPI00247FF37D|nr:phage tail spike protein [Staphylococcus felis]
MLLHVMNFDDEIIDSFGEHNNAILQAKHERKIDENRNESELLTIVILTKAAESFIEMRRILIKDENDLYREFIITRTEKDNNGYSTIEATASYLIDIGNARSIPKGKYEKMTAKEMGYEILRGIRWELGTVEWSGQKTMSWTSERTPFEMLKQMCTAFKLELDFTYEVDGDGISHRYVHFYKKKALFNGKEIKKGKDLISLKRVSDVTELNTALIALGPENEDGTRLRIEVVDEKAQTQFGANKRFIWGIYEPESEDTNMTESRLRTLATTELNKRKKIDVTYEVDALDIRKQFPHEVTRFGDLVRIKDRDFTPPLYAEAEVTGIEHDLVSDERKYTFGTPKEYKEEDLRRYFTERLNMLRMMMKDDKLNLNQIVETVRDNLVERVEQVVLQGSETPTNVKEGQLWYDTSNPDNAVLREFVGGHWLNATVEDIRKIGGLRREQIIYRELANTLPEIQMEHMRLQIQFYSLRDSEYLIDIVLKDEMNNKYSIMNDTFERIKQMFDALNEQDATIGQLTDVQAKIVEYRDRVQDFYVVVGKVDESINERIKLLQSQYTEEKFNEALNHIANKFGLSVVDNQLIGEPNITKQVIKVFSERSDELLSDYVKSEDYTTDKNGILERLNNADSERKQMHNQISDKVSLSEYNSGIDNAKSYADTLKQQQEQVLTTYDSRITQNGKDIALRTTKEEFNASRKTLSQVLSELTNNTFTGLTYTYDENGNIQSFAVGPDGMKIDTSKITIDAGDVTLKNDVFTVNKVNTKNVTIPRDDGGIPTIIDGTDKRRTTVVGTTPPFSAVLNGTIPVFHKAGYWYGCLKAIADMPFLSYDAFYFTHDRRYLEVVMLFLVGGKATSDSREQKTGLFVEFSEFSRPEQIPEEYNIYDKRGYVTNYSKQDSAGRVYERFVFDLGPPTGLDRQFYLNIKPNSEGPANPTFQTNTNPYAFAKFQIRRISTYG